MTATWGGAQWALATLWVIGTIMPIASKWAGIVDFLDTKEKPTWGQRFAIKCADRIGLAIILWWGGFWG